jgi:hypothetical protein
MACCHRPVTGGGYKYRCIKQSILSTSNTQSTECWRCHGHGRCLPVAVGCAWLACAPALTRHQPCQSQQPGTHAADKQHATQQRQLVWMHPYCDFSRVYIRSSRLCALLPIQPCRRLVRVPTQYNKRQPTEQAVPASHSRYRPYKASLSHTSRTASMTSVLLSRNPTTQSSTSREKTAGWLCTADQHAPVIGSSAAVGGSQG